MKDTIATQESLRNVIFEYQNYIYELRFQINDRIVQNENYNDLLIELKNKQHQIKFYENELKKQIRQ